MPKGYIRQACRSKQYEIVQLLRLTGAHVARVPNSKDVVVRMQQSKSWAEHRFTMKAFMDKYGPGTAEYRLLLKQRGADKIDKAQTDNSRSRL